MLHKDTRDKWLAAHPQPIEAELDLREARLINHGIADQKLTRWADDRAQFQFINDELGGTGGCM